MILVKETSKFEGMEKERKQSVLKNAQKYEKYEIIIVSAPPFPLSMLERLLENGKMQACAR